MLFCCVLLSSIVCMHRLIYSAQKISWEFVWPYCTFLINLSTVTLS